MTLIVSYITRHGIALVSDSNLTGDSGNTGFGQKVFPVAHLNAGLAYSGTYNIDGRSVDEYINDFIRGSFHTTQTIHEFTELLTERLNSDMRDSELDEITIIHIVGYGVVEHQSYCYHWHISNTGLDDQGNYIPAQKKFHLHNDFNSETDSGQRGLVRNFATDERSYQLYINGFPPGRKAYSVIRAQMEHVLNYFYDELSYGFHRPKNIFEVVSIVKLYFEFVAQLFKISKYRALYIGGEIQSHLIPEPQNINRDVLDPGDIAT